MIKTYGIKLRNYTICLFLSLLVVLLCLITYYLYIFI
jgi:hypothetical protein